MNIKPLKTCYAAGMLSMEEFISNNAAIDSAGSRSHCMFADGTPLYSGRMTGHPSDCADSTHCLSTPHALYRSELYFKRPPPNAAVRQSLSYCVANESESLFLPATAVATSEISSGYV